MKKAAAGVLLVLFLGVLFGAVVYAYPAGYTADVTVTTNVAEAVDVAGSGNVVHVVKKSTTGTLYYYRSVNSGATWSSGLRLDLGGQGVFDPQVETKGTSVFVAYTSTDPGDHAHKQLCVRSSNDQGATWSSGYLAVTNEGHDHLHARFGYSSNGSLLITYEGTQSDHSEVYLQEVTAGGMSGELQASANDSTADSYPCVSGIGANDYWVFYSEGNGSQNSIVGAHYYAGGWTRTTISNSVAAHNKRYPSSGFFLSTRIGVAWNDTTSGGGNFVSYREFRLGVWQTETSLYNPVTPIVYPEVADYSNRVYCRSASTNHVYDVTDGTATSVMTSSNPIAAPRCIAAASDGTQTFLVAASSNGSSGTVYFKRTDNVAPSGTVSINGTVTNGSSSPIYLKGNFPIAFNSVTDDFPATGTSQGDSYTNGVTSIAMKRGYDPGGPWTDLPTDKGATLNNAPWNAVVNIASIADDGTYYIEGVLTDTAGNIKQVVSGPIVVDRNAPHTAFDSPLGGTKGSNGWYVSNTRVTIIEDPNSIYDPDLSGIDKTFYRIKDNTNGKWGNWIVYGGPFTLAQGQWTVEAYSVDKAGNTESPAKSTVVKVDTTPPSATVISPDKTYIKTGFNPADNTPVTGEANDSTSGLAGARVTVNGKAPKGASLSASGSGGSVVTASWNVGDLSGIYEVGVTATDKAGNTTKSIKRVTLGKCAKDWYFAEGNTLPNFQEFICLQNPGDQLANVMTTFMCEDGQVFTKNTPVGARSRATVNVKDCVPEGHTGVSALVHTDNQQVVAERPMYFVYKPDNPYRGYKGGTNVLGVNTPQKQFNFAEGTTRDNGTDGTFEEWITIQNPGVKDANVVITYMLGTGQNLVKAYQVKAHSRYTVPVNLDVGPNQDVSASLVSDEPIVAERPMYFDYHRWAKEGHNVMGVASAQNTWHFAEGTTQQGYEEWITIQNPNSSVAHITATYMDGTGMVVVCKHDVGPKTRGTINVTKDVGRGRNVSADITSNVPVVAERPMYFVYKPETLNWTGGSDAMGAPAESYTYYIAEGCTQAGFDTWYCIQNPSGDTAKVNVTYMYASGGTKPVTFYVGPHSRLTVCVNDPAQAGPGKDVSAKIVSDHQINVERPMYFNYGGKTGGHVGSGFGVD